MSLGPCLLWGCGPCTPFSTACVVGVRALQTISLPCQVALRPGHTHRSDPEGERKEGTSPFAVASRSCECHPATALCPGRPSVSGSRQSPALLCSPNLSPLPTSERQLQARQYPGQEICSVMLRAPSLGSWGNSTSWLVPASQSLRPASMDPLSSRGSGCCSRGSSSKPPGSEKPTLFSWFPRCRVAIQLLLPSCPYDFWSSNILTSPYIKPSPYIKFSLLM